MPRWKYRGRLELNCSRCRSFCQSNPNSPDSKGFHPFHTVRNWRAVTDGVKCGFDLGLELGGYMGAIEESLSELAGTIQKQRINDAVLDEICKDYELLMADLNKVSQCRDNEKNRLQTDLENSLEGLRQEILTRV